MTRIWVLVIALAVSCSSGGEKVDPKVYLDRRLELATALSEVTKPLAGVTSGNIFDAIMSVVKNGKALVELLTGFKTPTAIPAGWDPCMVETKGAIDELRNSLEPLIKKALKIADDPTEVTGALKIAAAWDETQDRSQKALCRFRRANAACTKLAKENGIAVDTGDAFTGNKFAECK